ncbi:unnamed protein product [Sphenostylis stenocarpa]|uniref:Uncharacterized protein n=1 Tax=Sphenostylis stenocarpa TaxID=92480 RepID=A0AA86W1U6_9FABA|nr:unnamed protein product [Sphenostylis stenocarpa]
MALTRNTVVMFGIYGGNKHMVAANKIGKSENVSDIYSHTCIGADCNGMCKYRCSKAGRHKMCIRACNSCCKRCNCVPPGTFGNRDLCPCYATLTTHGGRLKVLNFIQIFGANR